MSFFVCFIEYCIAGGLKGGKIKVFVKSHRAIFMYALSMFD